MSMAQGVKNRMANLICGLELCMMSMKFFSVFSGDDEPIASAVIESIFLSARNLVTPRPREPFFMVGSPLTLVASDIWVESVSCENSLEVFASCEIPAMLQYLASRSSGRYLSLSLVFALEYERYMKRQMNGSAREHRNSSMWM